MSIFERVSTFGVFSANKRGPSRSFDGVKTERSVMELMLDVISVVGINVGVGIWLALFFSTNVITLINLHDKLYL